MSRSLHKLRLFGIKLDLEHDEDALHRVVARVLKTAPDAIHELNLVRRSFDARGRRPRFVHIVDVAAELRRPPRLKTGRIEETPPPLPLRNARVTRQERIAVVGAGPAGLFAALTLAQAGLKPILIDRGKPVETRGKDVGALMNRAILDPESNLCFGEGGAGTWSDGKLTTRISAPQVRHVLNSLHAFGAPERILTEGKPHLGTDKLVKILKACRKHLIDLGVEVRYSTRVDALDITADGTLRALILSDGERVDIDRCVLAVGHSARALYQRLVEYRVTLTPKPFAVGFRVEHPQALINTIQYGEYAEHPAVPTADYRLTARAGDRGVYSFCMCPGGQLMPTTTHPEEICVNGMSNASRSGRYANAALVVSVTPEDYGKLHAGPLAGAAFQTAAERAAATLGGGGFLAPAQTVPDFLAGKASTQLRRTTYRPGVTPSKLDSLYPSFIIDALKSALYDFDRRMPGFLTEDAVLHGVETRTSAPVQITRGEDLQSVNVQGLYPAGEGAGYAGGIVSAAVDGIRVADRIVRELSE